MAFENNEPTIGGRDRAHAAGRGEKRPYAPPEMHRLGSLYELTLGGSPGAGDSGNPSEANLAKGPVPPPFLDP